MINNNPTSTHERVTERSDDRASELPSDLQHEVACRWACARDTALSAERYPVRPTCEIGLSPLQINVIALILWLGARVVPYVKLSKLLAEHFRMHQSPESVRAVINRLAVRHFVSHKQARTGTIRGVLLSVTPAMLCSHIPRFLTASSRTSGLPIRPDARPSTCDTPSILEKTDRNNLSISSQGFMTQLGDFTEEDIAFHWPELAKSGFGTDQIRQILRRNREADVSSTGLVQGLTHAEWLLCHGKLCDGKGNPVESPTGWVFAILAKQGYYPRPKDYISPQEQAEKDAEEEATRLNSQRAARIQAQFVLWRDGLSSQERSVILGAVKRPYPTPDDVELRKHFLKHILPSL